MDIQRSGSQLPEKARQYCPPVPGARPGTRHYPNRDTLEWEWRFCNVFNEAQRFDVLFDNTSGTVRSTLTPPGDRLGWCTRRPCTCSH